MVGDILYKSDFGISIHKAARPEVSDVIAYQVQTKDPTDVLS